MITLGLILSVCVGILLGLLGGGGSILTVPLLHYVFGLETSLAVYLSLFVVGTAALVGAIMANRQGLVQWKQGALFAIPSIFAVFFTRKFILPAIPTEISLGFVTLSKGNFTLICFATVMFFAGLAMLKKPTTSPKEQNDKQHHSPKIVAMGSPTENKMSAILRIGSRGILVGIVTGFVGAGGGFLIVPALNLLLGMEMKAAVATSLAIIAFNSLGGFSGELVSSRLTNAITETPWSLMLLVTILAICGMFFGILLQNKIHPNRLKPAFGYFVLSSAVLILLKEVF